MIDHATQAKQHPIPGPGHNSLDRDRLRSLVERIEQIEDEKVALSEDLRGLYAEARSSGFDATALRQVIKLRRQDKEERDERQAIVDEYLAALGDFGTTALGQATIARAGGGLVPPV
jgi:uncharacterized protein (UPF0335 family)